MSSSRTLRDFFSRRMLLCPVGQHRIQTRLVACGSRTGLSSDKSSSLSWPPPQSEKTSPQSIRTTSCHELNQRTGKEIFAAILCLECWVLFHLLIVVYVWYSFSWEGKCDAADVLLRKYERISTTIGSTSGLPSSSVLLLGRRLQDDVKTNSPSPPWLYNSYHLQTLLPRRYRI